MLRRIVKYNIIKRYCHHIENNTNSPSNLNKLKDLHFENVMNKIIYNTEIIKQTSNNLAYVLFGSFWVNVITLIVCTSK